MTIAIGTRIVDARGTTAAGGGTAGSGVVFEIAPGGAEKIMHSFGSGSDGVGPFAGLIANDAGDLFGTTFVGGAYSYGTVFKIRNR